MDRRTFLKSSTAAAAISAGAAPATPSYRPPITDPAKLAAARHQWRIAPPTDTALRDAAIRLASRIETASAGQIACEWLGMTDGAGQAAFACGACNAAFGLAPDLLRAPYIALFTGLPAGLGLPPQDLLAWHTIAGGGALLDDAALRIGVKVLIAGHSGSAPGLWASGDVTDLRAFAGAAITATGLGAAVVKRIGAPYDQAPAPGATRLTERPADPVAALAQARSDGDTTWFQDGLHDHGIARTLVLSRATWENLDDGLATLVESIAIAETQASIAAAAYHRRAVLPKLVESGALIPGSLPGIVRTAIDRAAAETVAEVLGAAPKLEAARAAYDAFRRDMIGDGRQLPPPAAVLG